MRTLKLLSFLFLVTVCSSCIKMAADAGPNYSHFLSLSVKNVSGVDLVKELGLHVSNSDYEPPIMPTFNAINPDLYTLKAVYPDIKMDPVWNHHNTSGAIIPGPYTYKLEYEIKDDCYYLVFHPRNSFGYRDKTPPAPMITYKLSCPQIFGDDEEHEIITYWKPIDKRYQSCYRIEYNGKEFSNITHVGVLSYAELIIRKVGL